jgi:hypothetical protein
MLQFPCSSPIYVVDHDVRLSSYPELLQPSTKDPLRELFRKAVGDGLFPGSVASCGNPSRLMPFERYTDIHT